MAEILQNFKRILYIAKTLINTQTGCVSISQNSQFGGKMKFERMF